MINDYSARSEKRSSGNIVKQTSPSTYVVRNEKGCLQKRHIDQMIECDKPTLRRSPRLNN